MLVKVHISRHYHALHHVIVASKPFRIRMIAKKNAGDLAGCDGGSSGVVETTKDAQTTTRGWPKMVVRGVNTPWVSREKVGRRVTAKRAHRAGCWSGT